MLRLLEWISHERIYTDYGPWASMLFLERRMLSMRPSQVHLHWTHSVHEYRETSISAQKVRRTISAQRKRTLSHMRSGSAWRAGGALSRSSIGSGCRTLSNGNVLRQSTAVKARARTSQKFKAGGRQRCSLDNKIYMKLWKSYHTENGPRTYAYAVPQTRKTSVFTWPTEFETIVKTNDVRKRKSAWWRTHTCWTLYFPIPVSKSRPI